MSVHKDRNQTSDYVIRDLESDIFGFNSNKAINVFGQG